MPVESDSAVISLPGGVQVGWNAPEVRKPFVTTFTTMLIASRWGPLGLFCRLHCCADNLRCLLERLLGETRFLVAIKHLVRWRCEYICHRADDKVGVFALVYLSVFFQNGMYQITVRIHSLARIAQQACIIVGLHKHR